MDWKKIVKALLRILWMLRLVTPPEKRPDLPPEKDETSEKEKDKPPSQVKPMYVISNFVPPKFRKIKLPKIGKVNLPTW